MALTDHLPPLPPPGRRRTGGLIAVAALIAGGALGAILAGAGSAVSSPAAGSALRLDLVAAPTARAFVDNADDRTRGQDNNPFGNYRAARAPVPDDEKASGPYPGDEGLFAYALRDGHARQAGTAILACQFGFQRTAICQASYRLADGTLTASGTFPAAAKRFTLTVTGGTGAYRSSRGAIDATPAAHTGRGGLVLARQRLAIELSLDRDVETTTLTRYSVARREQFVHNGDDEARGDLRSPYAARDDASAMHAASLGRSRPVPGDEALFRFDVYQGADLGRRTGSATFACEYAFASDALCNAVYVLPDGTLTAQGAFGFDAPRLTLAVIAGTGRYRNATGVVEASPGRGHSQRLAFELAR